MPFRHLTLDTVALFLSASALIDIDAIISAILHADARHYIDILLVSLTAAALTARLGQHYCQAMACRVITLVTFAGARYRRFAAAIARSRAHIF